MNERINANELLSTVDIIQVIGKRVSLKKKGHEWVGLCPFHNDKNASLQVNPNKQIYKCFACGAGGDAIDFLMRSGATFHEAVKELSNGQIGTGMPEQRELPKPVKTWKQITPIAPPNQIHHYRNGEPSRVWAYHASDGKLIGYVCRFDKPEGKDVIPYSYCTDGTRQEWRWQSFDTPRPLYNLHQIYARPEAVILVVEGEKTAEAAQSLLPDVVVTCWPGGTNAVGLVDWSPLAGRKVMLWPDNDTEQKYGSNHQLAGKVRPWYEQPGNAAMLQIAGYIAGIARLVKWVKNPEWAPHKWDVADADWSPDECYEYLKLNIIDVPKPQSKDNDTIDMIDNEYYNSYDYEYENYQEPDYQEDSKQSYEPDPLPNLEAVTEGEHFTCLGWDKGEGGQQNMYFFVKNSRAVIRLAPNQMSINNILALAPVNWWQENFPSKREGINKIAVANSLVQTNLAIGMFEPLLIRGRGAWMDEHRVVIHAGSRLIVDGKPTALGSLTTRYIYEISHELKLNPIDPLTVQEANKLMDVIHKINWERDIDPYLLAGWCVVAPVCGALTWRPHIWLTGAAGTGKSWVFLNIVRKLLGNTGLPVQSETTEAGLRQTLGSDALPVIFDEAEGEDKKNQDRMQSVLSLMRAASSEDGGLMLKGTAGGQSKSYVMRSCFAFASISVQVAQQSDRSRVTIIGLRKEMDEDLRKSRWKELQKNYHDIVTDSWVERLQARTINILPIILKNIRTFAAAAATELGEQRAGDQLGALLAGAYSLYSDSEITYDEAVSWIRQRDLSEERGLNSTKDEIALFGFLMDQITKIETSYGTMERTIGELVTFAIGYKADSVILQDQAEARIKRLGIKVDRETWTVIISNTAEPIKRMLEKTAWSRNHHKILLRIEGAESVESTRFASGMNSRAVKVPLNILLD